jgi:hypothetical protein
MTTMTCTDCCTCDCGVPCPIHGSKDGSYDYKEPTSYFGYCEICKENHLILEVGVCGKG